MIKNSPIMQETWVPSLGQEKPLGREWLLIPVFLPRKSYGQKEPGRLQSIGLHRVRLNWNDSAQHSTRVTHVVDSRMNEDELLLLINLEPNRRLKD